ncbi:hypothetical protein GF358_04005 [Candidatus Woesearchaeota archaeon]|nr:hypothetical protein [Candidatus Woesearchaeota archaeon]
MVDSTLKKYIKKTIKQGYDISSIRSRLLKSGYSKQEINKTIKEIKGRKHINTKILAIAAIVIIILIITVIIALKLITPSPKQISISTTPLVSTVVPGGKLTFVKTIISPTSREAQVQLKHTLIFKQTGQTIKSQTETQTVGQRSSTQTQISLPTNIEKGQYEVITTLQYSEGSTQTSFTFIVETTKPTAPSIEEPKPEPQAICPGGCDDFNTCTRDICNKGICEHIPIKPCCGNRICETKEDQYNCEIDCGTQTKTTSETIDTAIKTARTDPQTATMICNSLPSVKNADDCFATISEKTGKSEYCQSIQNDEQQSDCLLNYALQGDYSVCDSIEDPYYLQSCFSLERQASLQGMVEEFR